MISCNNTILIKQSYDLPSWKRINYQSKNFTINNQPSSRVRNWRIRLWLPTTTTLSPSLPSLFFYIPISVQHTTPKMLVVLQDIYNLYFLNMINYNNTDITILLSAIACSCLNAIMNISPSVVIKFDEYSQRKMRIGLRTNGIPANIFVDLIWQ